MSFQYRVVLSNGWKEFEDRLNALGEEGFKVDDFKYFPKRPGQDREYIAIMVKENRY